MINQIDHSVIDQFTAAAAEQVNTSGLEAQDVLESRVRKSCWFGYKPVVFLIKSKGRKNTTGVPIISKLFPDLHGPPYCKSLPQGLWRSEGTFGYSLDHKVEVALKLESNRTPCTLLHSLVLKLIKNN